MRVCVDAGFIASAVLDEPLGSRVYGVLDDWSKADAQLVAPDLWAYEVVSITHIYDNVHAKLPWVHWVGETKN